MMTRLLAITFLLTLGASTAYAQTCSVVIPTPANAHDCECDTLAKPLAQRCASPVPADQCASLISEAVARGLLTLDGRDWLTAHRFCPIFIPGLTSILDFCPNANAVDFAPFGPGGVEWTVSAPAFTTPFNYGQRTASTYEVPFAGNVRAGCFVLSPSQPWLRVGHGAGRGQFIPDFSSTWEGEVNIRTGVWPTAFTLQVEIMGTNGSTVALRRTVSTALYALEPISFPTADTVLYSGVLDQALGQSDVVYEFPVQQNDQIRVSVCDLAAGSSLKVRHLVLRTWPL